MHAPLTTNLQQYIIMNINDPKDIESRLSFNRESRKAMVTQMEQYRRLYPKSTAYGGGCSYVDCLDAEIAFLNHRLGKCLVGVQATQINQRKWQEIESATRKACNDFRVALAVHKREQPEKGSTDNGGPARAHGRLAGLRRQLTKLHKCIVNVITKPFGGPNK